MPVAAEAAPGAFLRLGPQRPRRPVLLSVPHAGRCYGADLLARSRVPEESLYRLEDRYADTLIGDLAARGYTVLVAQAPRAEIDLNRDPRDIDPRAVAGLPRHHPTIQSAKQRGGLGLFPRALPRVGDLWRGAMPWAEAERRIATVHAPYHAALEQAMTAMHADFGEAVLVDVHSMPPLPPGFADPRPDVVVGDRFGAAAAPCFAQATAAVAQAHGLVAALNRPYSGFYLLERQGRPAAGRHAIQIELSRDLYLDARLDLPGEGAPRMRTLLADVVAALERCVRRGGYALAAE